MDGYLIEKLEGAALTLAVARSEEIILRYDQPWDNQNAGYNTVFKDGNIYKMYYMSGAMTSGADMTCYAESRDGITWTKPVLGLHEFKGSRENNIVMIGHPYCHNVSVLLDDRPGVPPAERYKAVGGLNKTGLSRFTSADGLRWREVSADPLFARDYALDSLNVLTWVPEEKQYAIYLRTWTEAGTPNGTPFKGRRTISRSVSKDFVTWTKPTPMSFGDTPSEHLYTNGTHPYFRAPHILIALAARFWPERKALTDEQMEKLAVDADERMGISDAVFMTSRGGDTYDRTFMESFIRPGQDPRAWPARSNYPATGVVQTDPAEMSLYLDTNFAGPDHHIRRYSLRLDGFASVKAPYAGGTLLTKPLKFSGRRLVLNYATSAAGSLRVELLDEAGRPLPGHSEKDCDEVIGDEISRTITWKSESNLAAIAGRTVRLRVIMKDADLFSLCFPN